MTFDFENFFKNNKLVWINDTYKEVEQPITFLPNSIKNEFGLLIN